MGETPVILNIFCGFLGALCAWAAATGFNDD